MLVLPLWSLSLWNGFGYILIDCIDGPWKWLFVIVIQHHLGAATELYTFKGVQSPSYLWRLVTLPRHGTEPAYFEISEESSCPSLRPVLLACSFFPVSLNVYYRIEPVEGRSTYQISMQSDGLTLPSVTAWQTRQGKLAQRKYECSLRAIELKLNWGKELAEITGG